MIKNTLEKVDRNILFEILRNLLEETISSPITSFNHLKAMETLSFMARSGFPARSDYILHLKEVINSFPSEEEWMKFPPGLGSGFIEMQGRALLRASETLIYFGQELEKAIRSLVELSLRFIFKSDEHEQFMSHVLDEEVWDTWVKISPSKISMKVSRITGNILLKKRHSNADHETLIFLSKVILLADMANPTSISGSSVPFMLNSHVKRLDSCSIGHASSCNIE